MTASTVADLCPACGQPTQPYQRTRRMHRPCYERRRREGTHLDVPRVYQRAADVVDDYLSIRAATGQTRDQIAGRLGMKPDTLTTALIRAARRGDTRVDYHPRTWRPKPAPAGVAGSAPPGGGERER